MHEELKLLKKLDDMRAHHHKLKEQIHKHSVHAMDALSLARMQKQMFQLRNEIFCLEQMIYPDLTA